MVIKTQNVVETTLECVFWKVRNSEHAKWGSTVILILKSTKVLINLLRHVSRGWT